MKIPYILLLFLIFTKSAFSNLRKPVNPGRTVFLMRHAEKPARGNDLSERGWLRAECISDLFTQNKTLTPKIIYAQRSAKKSDENLPDSRRQIQTVAPLARALNLEVNNTFYASEVDQLSKDISQLDPSYNPVLVSWNHEDIRRFLLNFGMNYRYAPKYPKTRFDLVWVIDENGNFSYFSENCEGLGDYRFIIYNS